MRLAIRAALAAAALSLLAPASAFAQQKTQKPPLHGTHWMAITGKPLAATASRSWRSSSSVARMRSRLKSLTARPCTISYLPFAQRTG